MLYLENLDGNEAEVYELGLSSTFTTKMSHQILLDITFSSMLVKLIVSVRDCS